MTSSPGALGPIARAVGIIVLGTVAGMVLATLGVTWGASTEGAAPAGAIALTWAGVGVAILAWAIGGLVARRRMVDRLRATDRTKRQVDQLAALPDRIAELGVALSDLAERVDGQPAQIARTFSHAQRSVETRVEDHWRLVERRLEQLETGADPAAAPVASTADRQQRSPRRVFVLGTGRCGTATFSAACSHFDNFTSAHESRTRMIGADRFAYPDHHIEVDNRLSWFLGELARRFDDDDTFYVHLTRSSDEVIASYARRWDSGFRSGITRAFGYGIVVRTRDWAPEEIDSVIRFYVETVTSNVESFLRDRPSMTIQLERLEEQFPEFVDRIGATGDLAAARAELAVAHNASPTPTT